MKWQTSLWFGAMLLSTEALAQSYNDCDQIKNVRRLASQNGLDERPFATLETLYCSATNTTSQDCSDLTWMARLSALSSDSNYQVIEKRRKIACAGNSATGDWGSGATSKYNNGSWNYPSGTTAKYTNGSWNYANGTTARYANGSWNYPNGTTARYANGNWNNPNGNSAKVEELLTQSCERVSEFECNQALKQIKTSKGDEQIFLIVEFSWGAWQRKSTDSYGSPTGSNPDPVYGSSTGQDCSILDTMGRLALIGGGDKATLKAIEKRRQTSCASNTDAATLTWANGVSAKTSNGKWSYPNGLTARTSDGKWLYPNGLTARTSDGKWSYPNGGVARTNGAKWYTPQGLSLSVEDLLTQSCDKMSRDYCESGLSALQAMAGEEKILGIIEFSWTAWNWKSGY